MSNKSILSFVSFYNGAGKTFSANFFSDKYNFRSVSFAAALYEASDRLVHDFNGADKDAIHPFLGISFRELNETIADAVHKKNPEIAVYRTKDTIRLFMAQGQNIVLHDIRRECDFDWVDQVAKENNYNHHIVEVYPVGIFQEKCKLDLWEYGFRADGKRSWEGRTAHFVSNNGSKEDFEMWLRALANSLAIKVMK